ncbi:hypothetical protein ACH5RR_010401 [Cinchona calisaya]|uniref:J domain-containing protein n=1 Tax=Cinchona calisaya TaxID=153742 RepID=A0ABD3AIU2_9GENT
MSANVISSGQFQLFPKSCNYARCGSQFPFAIISKPRKLSTKKTSNGGVFRVKARAAFYVPSQSPAAGSFYDLLGISETGSISDIKKAYKQLARKYHPDVSPPDRTEEYTRRFIMVQEAYETLSDPHTRALYDMDLARELPLAFSKGRRYERMDEVAEWRIRWQTQLDGLRLRSMHKDSVSVRGGKTSSWGSRMRRKRNDIFDLGFN